MTGLTGFAKLCIASSHIQFFNFDDSQNLLGMTDRYETFRDIRTTVTLFSMKFVNLHTIPYDFYGSPNEQNWMCELHSYSYIFPNLVTIM